MIELIVSLYAILTLILLVTRLDLGLRLLLPLLPLTTYAYRSPVTGLNATNLVIYVAFSMALFRRVGRSQVSLPPGTIALFSFFVMLLAEWILGYLNYRAIGYEPIRQLINVERWVLYTLLYFAYFYGWPDERPVTSAFRWMFVGVVLAGLFSVYDRALPSAYYLESGRVGGLFRQANSNGIFLSTYLFLPVALIASARNRMAKGTYLGGFLLGVYSLVLTLSRTAFLSLVAGALVYSFYRSKRVFALLVFTVLLLIPTYSVLLPAKVAQRISITFEGSHYKGVAGELEGSAANRLVQSIAGLKLFLDSPIIGHGIGGFWFRIVRYLPPDAPEVTRAAHTTFVWVLVEGGLVTLGALVWLLAAILLVGKRVMEGAETEGQRSLGLFVMAMVVSKSLANFFSTDFFTGDVSAYFWISGGLAALMAVRMRQPSAERRVAPATSPARVLSTWRPRQPSTLTRERSRG